MEAQPSCGPGPSAAADYPRWVLLDRETGLQHPSTADVGTLACCYGSTGRPLQVSLQIAAPPAVSTLHVHVGQQPPLSGGTVNDVAYQNVVAAHGDSVLINLIYVREYFPHQRQRIDYLVYNAGAGGARPPSLSLLPPCAAYSNFGQIRTCTGILRRSGGDEFVVASLNLSLDYSETTEADLLLLCSGECSWELISGVPVRHANGQEAEMSEWTIGDVIPVGDRFLYWIDLSRGILVWDVTAASPELRCVPLPEDPLLACGDGPPAGRRPDPAASQNVCVTGGETVKFVRVSPRCCCGGPGATACARSRRAFTVTTWTLKADDMTWEKDGLLDSDELWAAPVAADVPRVPVEHPVVSVDDPDVVFFQSSEYRHDEAGDKTVWLITVDMRRKTLRSVCRYPNYSWLPQSFLPSEVSSYFNTTRHGGGGGSSGTSASSEAIEVSAPAAANRVKVSPDEEQWDILAVIREIPGMARDEMLRAHSLLAGDDRRVRILEALPVDMRKEYCMLELERNLMHGAK